MTIFEVESIDDLKALRGLYWHAEEYWSEGTGENIERNFHKCRNMMVNGLNMTKLKKYFSSSRK